MIEIFNAVFHSFWTWAGTAILIAIVTGGLGRVITGVLVIINEAVRPPRRGS